MNKKLPRHIHQLYKNILAFAPQLPQKEILEHIMEEWRKEMFQMNPEIVEQWKQKEIVRRQEFNSPKLPPLTEITDENKRKNEPDTGKQIQWFTWYKDATGKSMGEAFKVHKERVRQKGEIIANNDDAIYEPEYVSGEELEERQNHAYDYIYNMITKEDPSIEKTDTLRTYIKDSFDSPRYFTYELLSMNNVSGGKRRKRREQKRGPRRTQKRKKHSYSQSQKKHTRTRTHPVKTRKKQTQKKKNGGVRLGLNLVKRSSYAGK